MKYTTAPAVGFRAVNDGIENSISLDTEVTTTLKILDGSYQEDIRVVRAYNGGVEGFFARETPRHLGAMLSFAEKQLFYGTVHGDAAGFAGLANDADLNGASDSNVVNAGGTTAGTASSVFLIATGPADVELIVKDGTIDVGDIYQTTAAGTTGRYDVYRLPITAHMGVKIGSSKSVIRIANLTNDSGKGLTDDLIAKALELLPSGYSVNFMAMTKRSQRQLRDSRTATSPTGAPAEFPSEAFNVPIVVTDNLINTETLLA